MTTPIIIESTRKNLSPYSGLIFFKDLLQKLNIEGPLGKILPYKERKRGHSNPMKFLIGMYAFIAGAECLDDIEILNQDPLFNELTQNGIAPNTMG